MRTRILWPIFALFLFSSACSEKQTFAPFNKSESLGVGNAVQSCGGVDPLNPLVLTNGGSGTCPVHYCSNFTLVKPQVDFLFLWDNSSSTITLADGIKQSLQKTLDTISDRFNYHILLAPLLGNSDQQADFNSFSLVVDNTDGLNSQALSIVKARENVSIFNNVQPQSLEQGFLRARTVISQNRNNGIFRNNAYTIVVMISNEDDDDYPGSNSQYGNPAEANSISTHVSAFLTLKSQMSALSFRFMSVVGQGGTCAPNASKVGHRYSAMSTQLYGYNNNSTDQSGKLSYSLPNNSADMSRRYIDSYNICTSNFSDLFFGINQSITEIVQKHIYGFWPLAPSNAPAFNPNQIQVTKSTGQVLLQGDPNGFTLLSGIQTRNLRIGPTPPGPGEPFTGYILQLNGTGQVTFPDCLIVQTQSPAEYYGYFVVSRAPDFSQPVTITINGVAINQSNTNGWQYEGFKSSQNVRIQGPILNPSNPHAPATPALNRTGYVFKLNGSAILTNGQTININYKPSAL